MLRPIATFFHGRNAFYVSLLLLPPLLPSLMMMTTMPIGLLVRPMEPICSVMALIQTSATVSSTS